MVESYSKNANHNMRRPVVKEEIVEMMRTRQAQNIGFLKELEDFARKENIPIIPHETTAYFRLLMQLLQPAAILEIGTAIGYSALLMAENSPTSKITTIDRNEEMIGFAKENFAKYDQRNQIELVEGEAMDVLPTLADNSYDFVFMDSAKSKYIVFLPEVLKKVKVGGLIILDDIFQGGDVARDIMEVRRGQRTIYRGLQRLFDATLDNPDLTASLVSMSDGLLMLRKNVENVRLQTEEN
ncbi:methyltransferase domain-containing protein [Streptococcus sp. zg-86]|uniref:tRNA 5-hydroxyuridine methyltransferase n=1 Tax=Streptococcus zhangguiae TaxID=2664091 RepID=A0A6I4RCB0_9STRE|nr:MULTISPECIES: O-methyltransferase [unclassified Streptococcus]MTB64297.1 methyltransferase domain-containing protein [Streptococcus sp. zg-86]MTB90607.1 methyltransferase domain-containing protein [Streptococcus sp. zg-36]MWV56398.1 methyltransferase domain-containing protein [Streptococcus sp. zg-70]QTH47394.1 O-methyltransferase [Streptococcus sp. zg-86]